jgi:hypothetical protein
LTAPSSFGDNASAVRHPYGNQSHGTMTKQRRLSLSITVAVCLLVSAPALFDRPIYRLYTPLETEANEGFLSNGEPSQNDLPGFVVRDPPARFWRNYSPETGVRPGYVRTVPFELKSGTLTIPVYGFPNSMFAGLYVESLKTQTTFQIDKGASHNQWDIYSLSLPQSLVHSEVRIVAYSNNAAALVGFGTPYYRENNALPGVSFSRLFVSVAISLGYLFLLFFPIFWVIRNVRKRFDIETLLAAAILTSLLCFLLFFCAYSFAAIGRTAVRTWLLGSLGLVVWDASRRREWQRYGSNTALLLLGLCTVFYGFFLFSFNTVSPSYSANYVFWPAAWSTDNQIPVETAALLAKGSIQSEWPFGSWKLSDRPPLLASLLYPLAVVLNDSPMALGRSFTSITLQIAASGLQGFWILPAWMFFCRLGLGRKECLTGCLIVAASPFVFFNSVYVWPKLLSAGFCLAQFVYLPGPANDSHSVEGKKRSLLSGFSAALAIIAHSGIILAVVAVALIGFLRVSVRRPAPALLSALAAFLVIVPWALWTKAVVPTTNPLPKYFFTGDYGLSKPDETVLSWTRNFYGAISTRDWLHSKGVAVQTLLGLERRDARNALGIFRNPFTGFSAVRAYQVFCLLPCLGVLGLAIVPLYVAIVRRSRVISGGNNWIRDLGIACFLGFIFHFLLMMSPHLLHHYPYFVLLALHLLAAASILIFNASRLMKCIALCNYGLFTLFWVVLPTVSVLTDNIAGLVLALAIFVLGSAFLITSLLGIAQPKRGTTT